MRQAVHNFPFLATFALALSLPAFTTASLGQGALLVKPGEKIAFMENKGRIKCQTFN